MRSANCRRRGKKWSDFNAECGALFQDMPRLECALQESASATSENYCGTNSIGK